MLQFIEPVLASRPSAMSQNHLPGKSSQQATETPKRHTAEQILFLIFGCKITKDDANMDAMELSFSFNPSIMQYKWDFTSQQ